jgi:hypothetical protein
MTPDHSSAPRHAQENGTKDHSASYALGLVRASEECTAGTIIGGHGSNSFSAD